MDQPSIVPGQETGASSSNEFSRDCKTKEEAMKVFENAASRLLDVNNWKKISGNPSAVFQLTDEHGVPVHRPARLGDHFRISIPGPGNIAGDGDDWVQVEAIEHSSNEDESTIAMRVGPTDNPSSDKKEVAHFFSGEATSSFSIVRKGKRVTASVQGRNEKPNLSAENIIDKLRNLVVGAGAMAGLNRPQWQGLVRGLLKEISPEVE